MVNVRACAVRSPLVSVAEMVDAGHDIHFTNVDVSMSRKLIADHGYEVSVIFQSEHV